MLAERLLGAPARTIWEEPSWGPLGSRSEPPQEIPEEPKKPPRWPKTTKNQACASNGLRTLGFRPSWAPPWALLGPLGASRTALQGALQEVQGGPENPEEGPKRAPRGPPKRSTKYMHECASFGGGPLVTLLGPLAALLGPAGGLFERPRRPGGAQGGPREPKIRAPTEP